MNIYFGKDRFYISKSGDDVRDIRWSAWDSDANRTAEGGTGREFDEVQGTALGSAWLTSNDLRYLIVENKNGNTANWTLSNLKIWSNVQSTGVADNLLNDLPTHTFDFTDATAFNAGDIIAVSVTPELAINDLVWTLVLEYYID